MTSPEVSLILPAWNEWANLQVLLPQLLADPYLGEVIVIDDASTDASDAEWSSAPFSRHPKLRRIRNEARLGLACSIHQGVRAARFPFLLIRDSDGNHTLESVARLCERSRAGAELCIASRYMCGKGAFSRANDLFSYAINRFLSRTEPRITDWTFGFFIVRRELLAELACDWIFRGRGEYSVRLFHSLLRRYPALRVEEVPTCIGARGFGRSTTKTIRHGLAYLALALEPGP